MPYSLLKLVLRPLSIFHLFLFIFVPSPIICTILTFRNSLLTFVIRKFLLINILLFLDFVKYFCKFSKYLFFIIVTCCFNYYMNYPRLLYVNILPLFQSITTFYIFLISMRSLTIIHLSYYLLTSLFSSDRTFLITYPILNRLTRFIPLCI